MKSEISKTAFLFILLCASPISSLGLEDSSELQQLKNFGLEGLTKRVREDICPDKLFVDILTDLPNKYPWEVHHVTTEDGYILRLFRIQARGTSITSGKKVVFLQHGLIDSADNWIDNTEDYSLGLVLANEGYDVWLGNSRGNKYSLDTVNPMKEKEYWAFSFQQMAQFDVPANIKYVLSVTGKETLSYIGHSQGTSQMFAALSDDSTRAYVNSKVNVFIALAPIVYLANQKSVLLDLLAYGGIGIEVMADLFGVHSLFPGACSETSAQSLFLSELCKIAQPLCNAFLSIADANPKYDNTDRLPYFMKHAPSGSSLMQFLHYKQWVLQNGKHPEFTKYDYGYFENQRVYGQHSPPIWNLKNITTKVRAFVGMQDALGDVTDNSLLAARLNDYGVDATFRFYDQCGHMTFMWSKPPTATKVFKDIKSELNAAN